MNVYRRHNPAKCKYTSRFEYRCKCPIWVDGYKNGKRINESLKLRDWNRANDLVRQWEIKDEKPAKQQPVTIEAWRDQFLQDAIARNLSLGTMRLYKRLFRKMIAFAADYGISFANSMELNALTKFRSTWLVSPRSATKELERLRSIYKFAVQRKMVNENYALSLVAPKVKQTPTLPFPADEEVRILKAAESSKVDKRVKTFILTMRYSGLRISDTATLAVDSLNGNRLKLYQAKTGEPVSVLIPSDVAEALLAVKHKNPKYFFWTGNSKVSSVADFWRKRISKVFKLAGITNGHPHRFRDTFAVSLLEADVSLENVSKLLGHQSVRITEKDYSPWVKTRQDALDKAVEKALLSRKSPETHSDNLATIVK
jgi:integrase/recombinase XerD